MEIFSDVGPAESVGRSLKKGHGSKALSGGLGKPKKKVLSSRDPNSVSVVVQGGVTKPQSSSTAVDSAQSSNARKTLGRIDPNQAGAPSEGKKKVAKVATKPVDDFEYPEIEVAAGRTGAEEEALMSKLRSVLAFDELPGANNEVDDCALGDERTRAQQQREQEEKLELESIHAADAEELCHAASLLDDDELDRILAGNSNTPETAGTSSLPEDFDLGLDDGFDL